MAFLTHADEQRVVRAIANAERGNRGEVRVHLEARCPDADPVVRARALYSRLGLHRTKGDTAVLLYVAPRSKVSAVWSGAGVHGRTEAGFWKGVTSAVAEHSRQGQLANGLVEALRQVGELLRAQVPGDDAAGNELPDTITTKKDVR